MGIDFLDLCFRIEKEFDLKRHDLDHRKLEVTRDVKGKLVGATATDVTRWVEVCMAAQGRDAPDDLWPLVRACIAATVGVAPEKVDPTSRIIEDLGFA